LEAKMKQENEQECSQEYPSVSFCVFLNSIFRGFVAPITINRVGFGYY